MILKRLKDFDEIRGKNLIVLGGSRGYINEIAFEYSDFASHVALILSINTNLQESVLVGDRKVSVKSVSSFQQENTGFDAGNTAFLILDDYYKELFDAIKDTEFLDKDTIVYWYANHETATELNYREKYKDTPLQNIVIFRSGPHASEYVKGMDFSDNARAVFEYMLKAGYDKNYELVWIVKDPTEYEEKYRNHKNVNFISWEWSDTEDKEKLDIYYRYLCLAKYFFFTDAYGFTRNCRSDQVRVQLWHGCGFKTRVNFVPCEHRYEYNIVVSKMYAKIHADIYGLRSDQVLLTGYPKEDWIFEAPDINILSLIHIPDAKRYILWLPTFRSTGGKLKELDQYDMNSATGLPIADTWKRIEELNSICEDSDTVIIVKLHPFQKELEDVKHFSNLVFVSNKTLFNYDIPVNKLMPLTDALISDYSSAAVDYLQLNRPVAFLVEDREKYKNSRGFVFDPIADWQPGLAVYDFEGMCQYVKDVSEGKDPGGEIRQKLYPKFHDFHDGNSSKRVVEAIIGGKPNLAR